MAGPDDFAFRRDNPVIRPTPGRLPTGTNSEAFHDFAFVPLSIAGGFLAYGNFFQA